MPLQHIREKFSTIPFSKWLFYILVVLLPFGTKKTFFTDHSFYFGYHAFYNTIYLYLTDLVFLCLILAWLHETPKFSIKFDKIYTLLFTYWLILAISALFSRETSLSMYGLIKITEFFLLFVFVREKIDIFGETSAFWLILPTLSFQVFIEIAQYVSQGSIGLKILGEEYIAPWMNGVAKIVSHETINPLFSGLFPHLIKFSRETLVIRSYGTLPHPNVLSGLLFAGIIISLYLIYVSPASPAGGPRIFSVKTATLGMSAFLLITGLILTFSRIAWLITGFAIVTWFILILAFVRRPFMASIRHGSRDRGLGSYRPQKLGLAITILAVSLSANLYIFGGPTHDRLFGTGERPNILNQEESLDNREFFNSLAVKMIKDKPLFGVGLKNYVIQIDHYSKDRVLPYLHQPVHNIYLLIASESGIPGLALFLAILYYIVRPAFVPIVIGTSAGKPATDQVLQFTILIIFFGFLLIGLFDHYFLTIQQGSLVFWIMLGLLARKNQ